MKSAQIRLKIADLKDEIKILTQLINLYRKAAEISKERYEYDDAIEFVKGLKHHSITINLKLQAYKDLKIILTKPKKDVKNSNCRFAEKTN